MKIFIFENFSNSKHTCIIYLIFSATDEYGESAPRVGFFHHFKRSEFVVKRWDTKLEDLSSDSKLGMNYLFLVNRLKSNRMIIHVYLTAAPEETVERLKCNIKELDRYLGPYPYDVWNSWKELTNKIDVSITERCKPECGSVKVKLPLTWLLRIEVFLQSF